MEKSDFRSNSIKLSMMKFPYTIGLFVYTLLPFIAYSCVEKKFGEISNTTIYKIIYVLLSFSIAFILLYYFLRLAYRLKSKYKYSKKELLFTILFIIFPLVALIINSIISCLYVSNDINKITFFILFSFSLVLSITSSILEFFSKINVLNKVNIEQSNDYYADENININVDLDEELIIKKKKEQTHD